VKFNVWSMFGENLLLYNPFCFANSVWRRDCEASEKCSRFIGDYKKCKRYIITVKEVKK